MYTGTPRTDDFRPNMYGEENGTRFVYNSEAPERRHEVVSLMGFHGEETDEIELAVGGVVKLAEDSFVIFTFPR